MKRIASLLCLVCVVLTIVQIARPVAAAEYSPVPAAWLSAWKVPPVTDRPLQIVHGIDAHGRLPDGLGQMLPGSDATAVVRTMQFYRDCGLGGVVCNVAFNDYLRSEENWKALVAGVEACRQLGLVVWIYDEEGYPSGSAGGLVLQENPAYEAKELAYDASKPDPFVLRPAYEFTHASNNYYAARRYINLIDPRAVQSFLRHTHEEYRKWLGPHFGTTIQAMFTDEPSLIAVNLGQIPEDVRKRVRVVDPPDPGVRPLPAVPWADDLPQQYQARYREDLLKSRKSLFVGDSPEDRKVRRQFWELIAELVADRYFGALEEWCGKAKVASSGHALWEEAVMHHPALEGNGLKALARMHIPGLDVLTSDPQAVIHGAWMTAALPGSAALLTGKRRVMTEVSDFSQKMSGQGPAGLAEMQATAAWQAAWGVTDFTLYYRIADRSAADYRAYCDYVGRLNAALKPARWDPEVLLYYPVCDLWPEYKPVAEPLGVASQSPRAQRIVASFNRLGSLLQRSQMPFALVDHEHLAKAAVRAGGSLEVQGRRFKAILLPEDVELPGPAARVIESLAAKGGRVVRDQKASRPSRQTVLDAVGPSERLDVASDQITLGRFVRDGRRVLLVMNVGREPYQGKLAATGVQGWQTLDPATGRIEAAAIDSGKIRLSLAPRQAMILVSGAAP